MLYLSSFFEAHRSDYYDRLQAVRERGEVQQWLRFFMAGVPERSKRWVATGVLRVLGADDEPSKSI